MLEGNIYFDIRLSAPSKIFHNILNTPFQISNQAPEVERGLVHRNDTADVVDGHFKEAISMPHEKSACDKIFQPCFGCVSLRTSQVHDFRYGGFAPVIYNFE